MATEDQQESMDTGSTQQESGPATPMDDSMCSGGESDAVGVVGSTAANTSGDADGDVAAEGGEDIPYDNT